MARYSSSRPANRSITSIQARAHRRVCQLLRAVGCPPCATDAAGPWNGWWRRGVIAATGRRGGVSTFGGRRKSNGEVVPFPTLGAPGVGIDRGGAVMRRSTAVAVLGGVVTVAAGAWVALVKRD